MLHLSFGNMCTKVYVSENCSTIDEVGSKQHAIFWVEMKERITSIRMHCFNLRQWGRKTNIEGLKQPLRAVALCLIYCVR